MHAVPHSAPLLELIERLLGARSVVQPSIITRIIFPGHEEMTTPPHQDYIFIQGSIDVLTVWLPFHDTADTGGLGLYGGSHRSGLKEYEVALGAGALAVKGELDESTFTYSPLSVGDALVFHSHTIHRGVENTSSRLRISADYRFQRQSEPMAETAFRPHLAHADWSTVYEGWATTEHQHFWEGLGLERLPYDRTLFVERDESAIALAEGGDRRALSALQRLVGTKQGEGNTDATIEKVEGLLKRLEEESAADTRGTAHMARLLAEHWRGGSRL